MDNIRYSENQKLDRDKVEKLYSENGWTLYTRNMEQLMNAIDGSLFTLAVWEEDKLVGLARVVGDGYTIIYLQDILLLPDYHRKGIGTDMMKRILEKYKDVRQKVLMTDNTEKQRKFYESLGFVEADGKNAVCYKRHDI